MANNPEYNRLWYARNRDRVLAKLAARRRAQGTPLSGRVPLSQRFWDKVEKTDGCWLWRAARDLNGYGRVGADEGPKRTMLAHRAAWTLLRGDIPDGLVLDHLCRNPQCVNPAHLEPVTQRVNLERARAAKL